MTENTTKTPVKRFHQLESVPDEQPTRGMSPVWITLAIILILEIAAMVWFYRICTRPPKGGWPHPASASAPAR